MSDRRLSLEAAPLRQSLQEVSVRWVQRQQILAGCSIKMLPGSYALMVVAANSWTAWGLMIVRRQFVGASWFGQKRWQRKRK